MSSPWLSRQLRSAQDLSVAARQVAKTGVVSVKETKALLKLPHNAGPERIVTLDRLAKLASTTHAALSHVDLGPSNALLGPLARQRNKFSTELAQVQTTLACTSAAASAAASILKGPLTVPAVHREQRRNALGLRGLPRRGDINGRWNLHLAGMMATGNLILPEGVVPIGGDLEACWGHLSPVSTGEIWDSRPSST